MAQTWDNDDCSALKAYYTFYSVPAAAARWCNVPEDRVEKIVSEAQQLTQTGFGRGVWKHPEVTCLEPRTRAIAEAIESGELPHGREDGQTLPPGESAAAERRHVLGRDLKAWLEKTHPTERPAFLFDEIERSTHASISTDAYQALQANHDKLEKQLATAKEKILELQVNLQETKGERDSLRAMVEKMSAPGERAQTTYLNIIGAMLDVMLSKSLQGQPYSSFTNQSAVIQALLGHHEGKQGISARTLEEKFAEAKRSLKAS